MVHSFRQSETIFKYQSLKNELCALLLLANRSEHNYICLFLQNPRLPTALSSRALSSLLWAPVPQLCLVLPPHTLIYSAAASAPSNVILILNVNILKEASKPPTVQCSLVFVFYFTSMPTKRKQNKLKKYQERNSSTTIFTIKNKYTTMHCLNSSFSLSPTQRA